MPYGVDFLTGGTPDSSQDGAGSGKANAVDNNTGTTWATSSTAFVPEWWSYDLGAGITKIARKARIFPYYDGNGSMLRDALIQGSNNNTDWTTLYTIDDMTNAAQWSEFEFANSTAYRYYRIYITATWRGDGYVGFNEVELMEFTSSGFKIINVT